MEYFFNIHKQPDSPCPIDFIYVDGASFGRLSRVFSLFLCVLVFPALNFGCSLILFPFIPYSLPIFAEQSEFHMWVS